MEELAAKREGARQRKIRQREKDKENNDDVTRDADVENVDEFSKAEEG
jgi:hypothetical protein